MRNYDNSYALITYKRSTNYGIYNIINSDNIDIKLMMVDVEDN